MAVLVTDAVTAVAAATANKFVAGDGYTDGNYMLLAYRIDWSSGTTFAVNTAAGSKASDLDVSVSWDGADYKLDIDLSALDLQFTGIPAVVTCSMAAATDAASTPYRVDAKATSVSDIYCRFVSEDGTDHIQTPDGRMFFYIFIFGTIA